MKIKQAIREEGKMSWKIKRQNANIKGQKEEAHSFHHAFGILFLPFDICLLPFAFI
jgi:hypothetical protein